MSNYLSVEKLWRLIEQNELLRDASAKFASIIQPSIRLMTAPLENEDEVGNSRIGGTPDLPKDIDWPLYDGKIPMLFLAQINLKDISTFDCASRLPREGLLSFFTADPYSDSETSVFISSGVFEQKNMGRVMLHTITDLERKNSTDIVQLPSRNILFRLEDTFPPTESAVYEDIGTDDGGTEELHELIENTYEGDQSIHKMFGHPDQEQGDLRTNVQRSIEKAWENSNWDEIAQRGKDLVLLFQMDSDNDLDIMWGDGGRIYFFIKPDDLAKGDFSKVWCETECG